MKKRFGKKDREKIINDYLNQTGRNSYVPAEFVDWIQNKPDHPVYKLFGFEDDEKMALKYRIQMARQFATGCKITVQYKDLPTETIDISDSITVVDEKVVRFPTFISPIDGRAQGGGYQRFDLNNPEVVAELCRQSCRELRAWINRHEGICTLKSIDIETLSEIADSLESESVNSEAV